MGDAPSEWWPPPSLLSGQPQIPCCVPVTHIPRFFRLSGITLGVERMPGMWHAVPCIRWSGPARCPQMYGQGTTGIG